MPWFHHILVHFPISFAALAAALVVAAVVRPSPRLQELAWWVLVLATVAGMAAATTGLLSADHFVDDGGDVSAVAQHRNFALVGMGLLAVSAGCLWLARRRAARSLGVVSAVSAAAACLAVLFAAHEGGEMVHPGLSPWSTGHSHGEHADNDDQRTNPAIGPVAPVETSSTAGAAGSGSSPTDSGSAPLSAPSPHDGREHLREHDHEH